MDVLPTKIVLALMPSVIRQKTQTVFSVMATTAQLVVLTTLTARQCTLCVVGEVQTLVAVVLPLSVLMPELSVMLTTTTASGVLVLSASWGVPLMQTALWTVLSVGPEGLAPLRARLVAVERRTPTCVAATLTLIARG